jgi:LAO/AO transport system kinase
VLLATASAGEGVDAVVEAIDRHAAWLARSEQLEVRRRRRLAQQTREVVRRAIDRWVWSETPVQALIDERLDDMTAGSRSPYDVAAEAVTSLKEGIRT